MKTVNIIASLFLCIYSINCFAKKQTFDFFKYTSPQGWKKEIKEGVVSYTYIDKKDRSCCQTGLYKSTTSQGDIDADLHGIIFN